MDKKATLIVMLFCSCLFLSAPCIAFASSGNNWVEIITFTHSVSGAAFLGPTSHFTVDYADWRIRWEINPGNGSEETSFSALVFPDTNESSIDGVGNLGTEETNGTLNIYDHRGSFYIIVQTQNVDNFELIIEQNIDSVPEFPAWIVLPAFLVASLSAVVFRERLFNKRT